MSTLPYLPITCITAIFDFVESADPPFEHKHAWFLSKGKVENYLSERAVFIRKLGHKSRHAMIFANGCPYTYFEARDCPGPVPLKGFTIKFPSYLNLSCFIITSDLPQELLCNLDQARCAIQISDCNYNIAYCLLPDKDHYTFSYRSSLAKLNRSYAASHTHTVTGTLLIQPVNAQDVFTKHTPTEARTILHWRW